MGETATKPRGRTRDFNMDGFEVAAKIGAEHGIRVTNPTRGVVQLRWGDCILDVYPRRNRLRAVRGSVPRLVLRPGWGILDVVIALVKQRQEGAEHG